MCLYCAIGDFFFRHDPPWERERQHIPYIPAPGEWPPAPHWQPWGAEKLRELEDLLRRVKELEDKLGCPCEPNKADYLGLLRQRIEDLERKAAGG